MIKDAVNGPLPFHSWAGALDVPGAFLSTHWTLCGVWVHHIHLTLCLPSLPWHICHCLAEGLLLFLSTHKPWARQQQSFLLAWADVNSGQTAIAVHGFPPAGMLRAMLGHAGMPSNFGGVGFAFFLFREEFRAYIKIIFSIHVIFFIFNFISWPICPSGGLCLLCDSSWQRVSLLKN